MGEDYWYMTGDMQFADSRIDGQFNDSQIAAADGKGILAAAFASGGERGAGEIAVALRAMERPGKLGQFNYRAGEGCIMAHSLPGGLHGLGINTLKRAGLHGEVEETRTGGHVGFDLFEKRASDGEFVHG
jgi:hypothetical protein